jgi:uncharacterized metal-binding protein YceD (DUF177 family)
LSSEREYVIPFVGLKLGVHDFELEIRDAFFEELEYSIIQKGNAHVKLRLDKKETMLIGEFSVTGVVFTSCDRCNDPVEVPLTGSFRLIYKFGDEHNDDETLIVLPNETYELDLRQNLYEFMTVSLPSRLVHPEGTCNEDMIELLQKYSGHTDASSDEEDERPADPRWSALKNLN